jgi:Short-chain dehydrogenases of various substrate specificities
MELQGKRVLLTGAAGGIGSKLGEVLAGKGARLCLLARGDASIARLRKQIGDRQMDAIAVRADITDEAARRHALARMREVFGGIDVLINLAGQQDFHLFADVDPWTIPHLLQVNLEAPMQLAREVLPDLLAQHSGRIVNIGSIFGSIGYPGFATYSASKFALRGFSQALRRELADSGVGVTYVAPRAVRTPFNPAAVNMMAVHGMMHMDEPDSVAARIARAIERDRDEAYLGFPESLFVRVNALLPRLVDRSLRKLLPALARYARGSV